MLSMQNRLNEASLTEVVRNVLSQDGSENYTLRTIREKVAEIVGVDSELLKEQEWKHLIEKLIEEHMESMEEVDISNDAEETQDQPESSSDVETFVEEVKPAPAKKVSSGKRAKDIAPEINAAKKAKVVKSSMKTEKVLSKLKSFVFQCGVRKIWKKELEGLSEAQSISKVRTILQELGVEGRPTIEKCKKVKEQREYKEEMGIIDKSKILDSRLRSQRKSSGGPVVEEVPKERKLVPRLDLSAFGDSDE